MPGPSPTRGCKCNSFGSSEARESVVSSWKAVQLPGPVISWGTPAKGAACGPELQCGAESPCSVSGVAVQRSTTLSRKGWPGPGTWQWGIKPITDLDVIQSKPPSSWTNLQLRGSYFKVPLGDTALPFSGFILAAKPGCVVPCGPACTVWPAELCLSQWTSKSCHHCKISFITLKKNYCGILILLVRVFCSKILLCNPSGNHSSSSEEHRLWTPCFFYGQPLLSTSARNAHMNPDE